MLQKFIVEGQKKLNGTISVSGAKNAALPILCAALLSDEPSEISNVPDIADIHTLLKIFEDFHVKTSYHDHKVVIDPARIAFDKPKNDLFGRMRAAILLLGPLIQRFNEIQLPFPGGCVLGKRSIFAHTYGLKAMGVEVLDELETIHVRRKRLHPAKIIMPEFSVTSPFVMSPAMAKVPASR
jgi:UDP-N-acetylglucosamine 1-carboxyvinyltransferase